MRFAAGIALALMACSRLSGLDEFALVDGSGGGSSQGGAGASGGASETGGEGSEGGAGGCGPSPDLASDPRHCGACGHDCFGGECSGGKCQPYLLIAMQTAPVGVALTSTHLYWTHDTRVSRAALDGTSVELLHDAASVLGYVDVDSDGVFFANYGAPSLWRMGLDGASPAMWKAANFPVGLALDAARVYTTEWFDTGDVVAHDKTGGGSQIIRVNGGTPEDVAISAQGDIFWTENTGGSVWVRRSQGTPEVFADSQPTASGVAVDDTHVYWSCFNGGEIRRRELAGGGPIEDVTIGQQPNGIALGPDRMYWADRATNSIRALAK